MKLIGSMSRHGDEDTRAPRSWPETSSHLAFLLSSSFLVWVENPFLYVSGPFVQCIAEEGNFQNKKGIPKGDEHGVQNILESRRSEFRLSFYHLPAEGP